MANTETETHIVNLTEAAQAAARKFLAAEAEPEGKVLRVGVNSAMVDHAALVRLLIAKGIFTLEEYEEALEVQSPPLGHAASFTAACMGEDKTRSPFRVGGDLTKTLLLGVICQRLKEELQFDRETERFVGNDRANALLDGPPPRSGWEEFYKMA